MECKIDNCDRTARSLGLCRTHYRRYHDGTPMDAPIQTQRRSTEVLPCKIDDCIRPALLKNGICRTCNDRMARGGSYDLPRPSLTCVDANGYVRLNTNHPMNNTGKQVYAHRHVMELHLGRKLLPEENVHHINGDRSDYSLKNLELWNTSQPPGQRVEDKVAWAREILALYGD